MRAYIHFRLKGFLFKMGNTIQTLTSKDLSDFFYNIKSLLDLSVTEEPTTTTNFTVVKYNNFFSAFDGAYQKDFKRGAEINVWQQAGLKRDEVRNTSVLAWWLDEKGSHGLGTLLLNEFVNAINKDNQSKPSLCCDGNYATYVESLPLAERENRIDIELLGKKFLLFIEVKISASEGDKQLDRYLTLLDHKAKQYSISPDKAAVIYLTTNNIQENIKQGIYCISWQQVANAFYNLQLPDEATFTQLLLRQFCQHIKEF